MGVVIIASLWSMEPFSSFCALLNGAKVNKSVLTKTAELLETSGVPGIPGISFQEGLGYILTCLSVRN